jgi:multiple sugar transport system ATP-binding protein
MARLTISDLHKFYGQTHAVRGVDLDIPEGEFAVLVGPSGCGKSTLLRSIAGLEPIDGGTIAIDGEVINEMRPRDRNVAMVFQNYALYPYMNVYENIAFGLRARRFEKTEIERRVQDAAAMLDIASLLERLPRQLSGGQRQRVAIGRAIVRDARLFLFDEPLSNLDAKLRDEMRSELKRLHTQLGKTMVYVTHDQVEAMTLADRIVLLKDGRIEQQGAPLDLFERPQTRFVAGFLGSPSMNFVPATLAGGERGIEVGIGTDVRLPVPAAHVQRLACHLGKPVTFGIRPEHLHRAGDGEVRSGLAPVTVTVDLIQPTGSRTYATFRLDDTEVVAELQAHEVERPGERLTLHVDMNRAIVIDPATEHVL